MSILGGIWHFDGKPVDRGWLAKLSAEMAQHGLDGEFFYTDREVGMVYRPFHTTAESRLETSSEAGGTRVDHIVEFLWHHNRGTS